MYRQINPTELFRERHLALLQEAENRRISWRLRGEARRRGVRENSGPERVAK